MKRTVEFSANQLFEIERGLQLRVAECKTMTAKAKSIPDKHQWGQQLTCAMNTLAIVEDMARA